MSQMVIDPDGLHAHASNIDYLGDRVGLAEQAAAATVGDGAFGVLCSFLGMALDALAGPAQAALGKAEACLDRQAANLREAARLVEQGDADEAAVYAGLSTDAGYAGAGGW